MITALLGRKTVGAILLATSIAATPAVAETTFDASQREEIEKIIRSYLVENPAVLQEALAALEKKQEQDQLIAEQRAVDDNKELLFNSPLSFVAGNPDGDVTLVEFFDYNCGYCKRSLADILELIESDPKLRVVFKEWPVLGEGSVDAARVATAVFRQGPYMDFHLAMMGSRAPANKETALATAERLGYDMDRIKEDLADPQLDAAIAESYALSNALELGGTPTFVVGNEVVRGAVGIDQMRQKIAQAREALCTTC